MPTEPEVLLRISMLERKVSKLYEHLDIGEPGTAELAGEDVPPGVIEAIQQGNTVEAIKAYRQGTGADLATAKEMVERLALSGPDAPGGLNVET